MEFDDEEVRISMLPKVRGYLMQLVKAQGLEFEEGDDWLLGIQRRRSVI